MYLSLGENTVGLWTRLQSYNIGKSFDNMFIGLVIPNPLMLHIHTHTHVQQLQRPAPRAKLFREDY